jgi:aminoglycoside phosphotransferase family enzyme
MRRLPPERTLLHLIGKRSVEPRDIDALIERLVAFYRLAPRIDITPEDYLGRFLSQHITDRELLMNPRWRLPDAARALDAFDAALTCWAPALQERAEHGRIVEGHGDLRPEHVWLTDPPVVIDCLEFSAPLRQVDPFDELAFLALECGLAGADWIGERLVTGCAAALGDAPSPALMAIHTAQRALLRARLAMAHLLDPQPRTPERWPLQAGRYLGRALDALDTLAVSAALSPEGRPGNP